MKNTQLQKDFRRFLTVGAYCTPPGRAACALDHARTLQQWAEAEAAGLVRIEAEPEQDNYFDVYGAPDTDGERKQIEAELDRVGCWVVFTEVNHGTEGTGDDWQHADSIGMCVYANPCDPFQNCYVVDLMAAALGQIPQPGNVDELCTALA